MSSFWQFFDSQMAIFWRVRWGSGYFVWLTSRGPHCLLDLTGTILKDTANMSTQLNNATQADRDVVLQLQSYLPTTVIPSQLFEEISSKQFDLSCKLWLFVIDCVYIIDPCSICPHHMLRDSASEFNLLSKLLTLRKIAIWMSKKCQKLDIFF